MIVHALQTCMWNPHPTPTSIKTLVRYVFKNVFSKPTKLNLKVVGKKKRIKETMVLVSLVLKMISIKKLCKMIIFQEFYNYKIELDSGYWWWEKMWKTKPTH